MTAATTLPGLWCGPGAPVPMDFRGAEHEAPLRHQRGLRGEGAGHGPEFLFDRLAGASDAVARLFDGRCPTLIVTFSPRKDSEQGEEFPRFSRSNTQRKWGNGIYVLPFTMLSPNTAPGNGATRRPGDAFHAASTPRNCEGSRQRPKGVGGAPVGGWPPGSTRVGLEVPVHWLRPEISSNLTFPNRQRASGEGPCDSLRSKRKGPSLPVLLHSTDPHGEGTDERRHHDLFHREGHLGLVAGDR